MDLVTWKGSSPHQSKRSAARACGKAPPYNNVAEGSVYWQDNKPKHASELCQAYFKSKE